MDPGFVAAVERPTYRRQGPIIVFDAAHKNFHTASGQYKPLVDLLAADGFRIVEGHSGFTRSTLARAAILVVANAGSATGRDTTDPAFSEAETESVARWVREGGSLLLIADHSPFGVAARGLAARFGVELGNGWVMARDGKGKISTQVTFSRENGLLPEHPITNGRRESERVRVVRSFSGESLTLPRKARALLALPGDAREAPTRKDLDAAVTEPSDTNSVSVAGRVQGLAMTHGRGRVVILGEAGMLSAQLVKLGSGENEREIRVGMNYPGVDNRRFALNLFHWLARTLN
ncbi:MAG: hypothetical protein ACXWUZ_00985 [Allosphingosinicella sp.]